MSKVFYETNGVVSEVDILARRERYVMEQDHAEVSYVVKFKNGETKVVLKEDLFVPIDKHKNANTII